MAKRGTKEKPTEKQKRAIDGFKAVLTGKSSKSFRQVLEEAGYAHESAKQWTNIMAGIRPHLQPTIDWTELHRARIQEEMERKVGQASYADLARSLDIVTKAIQLLGGKPTQVLGLPQEDRNRIDRLIQR